MLTRHDGEVALPALNMTVGAKVLRVAFIGRYYYQKRPIVMARTLGALARWARRNGVELRATLVGEGPFRREVEQLVRSYGLGDAVEFLSASADVLNAASRQARPRILRNMNTPWVTLRSHRPAGCSAGALPEPGEHSGSRRRRGR